LSFVHKRAKILAPALLLILISSNALALTPFNWEVRWLLPAFVKEIHGRYPTPYRAVSDFLAKRAQPEDLVYAFPEYCNDPLMFYLGDTLRFCCLLDQNTPLPTQTVRELQAPLFREEHFPHWYVAFGKHKSSSEILNHFSRKHKEDGAMVRFHYREVKALDVYWFDRSRPELPLHSFGPVEDFDRAWEGVYIFRRN